MRTSALLLCLLLSVPSQAAAPALDPIPDGAWMAGALKSSSFEMLRSYFMQTPEMQRDLGTFFTKRLGVDLTRIDGIVFWSTQQVPQPTFGAFIRLPQSGPLKGKHRTSADGLDLVELDKQVVATAVAGGLVVGEEAEVRAGVAVAQRKSAGLGPQSALAELIPLAASSDLIAGVAASALKDPQARGMAEQYGIRTVTFSLRGDGKIALEANGNGERLKSAAALLDATMKMALTQLKVQHDQALSDETMDFANGLGAVAGYHQLAALWKEAAPKIEGDKMVCRYQLPQMKTAGMVVPMIGVGAAIAVPAFMKYVRRSKSVEATMNVRRLADAAASRQGKPLRSTEWTPAGTCCGHPGDKCAPDPKLWSGPTWKALEFSVDDPFYYQYRVTTQGKGKNAKIVVEARGDLDCDGKFSSYKRTVSGGTAGPLETADDVE